jgi:glycosyltransferase involved in cell wall biosynthesis
MNYQYVMSILNLSSLCAARGIGVDFYFIANESLIQRARNLSAQTFLAHPHATHLLFIDADIQFNPEHILRMIDADVDIIGGIYAKKQVNWDRLTPENVEEVKKSMSLLVDSASPININATEDMTEVQWLATGCMLIKKHVFEKIKESDNTRWITTYTPPVYAYFDCMIWNGNYLSEDYYFCQRWKDLGGKIYAANWAKCMHWGTFGFQI